MNALIIALQYLPYILEAVKAVEKAAEGIKGASKKQVVLSTVVAAKAIGAIGSNQNSIPQEHIQIVDNLIDSVVAALNNAGALGVKN